MFWLEEGVPSSLAPGKATADDAEPDARDRDGEPASSSAHPGGTSRTSGRCTMFLEHRRARHDLQAATDAPAHLTDHFPRSFFPRESRPASLALEPGAEFADETAAGHDLSVLPELGRWAGSPQPDGTPTGS